MATDPDESPITALSVVEPSLATPLDPDPKPKRQRRQAYPESERVIALMVTSLVGVKQASTDLGIPRRTIYGWLADMGENGGLAEMQAQARTVLGHTLFATALEVCRELRGRLPKMDDARLLEAVRVLSAGAVSTRSDDESASGANAQAAAYVEIKIGDEVIQVARPRTQGNDEPQEQAPTAVT